MITHDSLYIDGCWTKPSGTGSIEVLSPHAEEVVGRTPHSRPADVDRAVAAARTAFDHGPWPRMFPAERGAILNRLAAVYERRAEDMAR